MTISVCPFERSFEVKSCLNTGRCIRPGKPVRRPPLVLAQQSGEKRRLAIAQPDLGLDFSRAERRQVLSGDVHVLPERAALDGQLENHVAIERHAWRHIDDDTDRADS